jgi:hypothetical protein
MPSSWASRRMNLSGKGLASRTASASNYSESLGSPPDGVKSTRSLVLQLDIALLHIGTHKGSAPTCTLGCLVDTPGRNDPQSNHPTAIIVPNMTDALTGRKRSVESRRNQRSRFCWFTSKVIVVKMDLRAVAQHRCTRNTCYIRRGRSSLDSEEGN